MGEGRGGYSCFTCRHFDLPLATGPRKDGVLFLPAQFPMIAGRFFLHCHVCLENIQFTLFTSTLGCLDHSPFPTSATSFLFAISVFFKCLPIAPVDSAQTYKCIPLFQIGCTVPQGRFNFRAYYGTVVLEHLVGGWRGAGEGYCLKAAKIMNDFKKMTKAPYGEYPTTLAANIPNGERQRPAFSTTTPTQPRRRILREATAYSLYDEKARWIFKWKIRRSQRPSTKPNKAFHFSHPTPPVHRLLRLVYYRCVSLERFAP